MGNETNKMNFYNVLNSEKRKLKQIAIKDKFENIKNDYFIQIAFSYLNKKISLEILKYNKNLKKRINLNINDYKRYSEIFTPIEIEIIPENNKYGKFININEGDELFHHIYFNNEKEEIKRYYIDKYENISNINIIIDYQIKSFKELFKNCECIKSINFKKFYRTNINNMRCMFRECLSL